jgi:hypothetical protein
MYNENERAAYLEGLFVNLQTGKVYPDFNDKECLIEQFEILPHETIYVGQDINDFYNKMVCMVIRDKCLYVVKNIVVKNIGDCAAVLRNTFPTQAIFYFPDAGGQSKTIINAYLNEFRLYNIQLRLGNTNPNIVERVFIINKLFKMKRLFVFKSCSDLIMDLKIRCFDKLGKPEKGKDEKSPDHNCDSLEYVTYRVVNSITEFIEFMKTIKREKV